METIDRDIVTTKKMSYQTLEDQKMPFYSDEYNTAIKDIAGIKDYTILFNVINAHFSDPDSVNSMITDVNDFDIRTSKTRIKVSWAINKSILQFKNQGHMDLVGKVFQNNVPNHDKKFAFMWHFCLTNRLFREITVNVFSKIYFSGRAQISKEDIIGYIKTISARTDRAKSLWSEETIYRLATKYLSLMTKFDFLSNGRIKSFHHIRPTEEALVLFLYFARFFSPNKRNVLINPLLPASFILVDDFYKRLKALSIRGYIKMNFNGEALNFEPIHNPKDICDVLFN